MTESELNIERRAMNRRMLARMDELEKLYRQVLQELTTLKELTGRDIRAHELLKRLIVGIDSAAEYDHDTLVLFNDQERQSLRAMIHREQRDEVVHEIRDGRIRWFNTWWARVGGVIGVLALLTDMFANLHNAGVHFP